MSGGCGGIVVIMRQITSACAGTLFAILSVAAIGSVFQLNGAEVSIAEQKASLHRQLTGESAVGYRGVRLATKAAIASPLVENVVGCQLVDGTVQISYDLNSSYQCEVFCAISVDGVLLAGPLTFAEGSCVGITTGGQGKKIIWKAKSDWDNQRSDRVKALVTATETDVPSSWAHITIAWSEWGGKDIDICGYWVDKPEVQVGYSHGSGSTASAWRSAWKGDNTGSGPEYVLVAVAENEILSGVTSRRYRIHFNHYGEAAANPHVRVTVFSNGVTKSKTCRANTRRRSAATTTDPYVTISFDENGTPTSID